MLTENSFFYLCGVGALAREALPEAGSSRGLLTAPRLTKVTRSHGLRGGIILQVHHSARVAELADAPDLGTCETGGCK
jgi:hypothetical protein